MSIPDTAGTVYLVGAGPGDPGLLTVKARELVECCDLLVYDALVSPAIMAMANPKAERIFVGKRGGESSAKQDDINSVLADRAREGKTIVRLKGGDPYLFGRGAEEALFLLDRGVRVEVVPGVTAGIAAPAYAGIPVTHREHASAVAFVTGHEDPDKPESALDWAALSKVGTLCFYMGVKNLGRIAGELSKHLPRTTPVALVQWGTTPKQRSVAGTLADIEQKVADAGIQAPALTVVGNVIALRERLNFFEQRPLFGKRVVVTRSRAQASDLAEHLEALGAQALRFPTIRIAPPEDTRSFSAAVGKLANFGWVVLTSVNGVDALFEELDRQNRDARAFGAAKVAAIGPATRDRLAARGIKADLVPPQYVAESIVASLKDAGVFAKKDPAPRFLLARADIARSALPEQLRELGADVTETIAYTTVLETEGQDEALAALAAGEVDAVTFTSSSTARNFAEILGKERLAKALALPRLKCLSIGPITSATMRELKLPLHGEAAEHDIPGLVALLRKTLEA
ncbi:MAG: uroporphyrinogen-III C-methyltransferase [Planctomycetes bacterium]|nr:uroporphyrinogen-III C-methyltransferase [Planctomycetota bacterium]